MSKSRNPVTDTKAADMVLAARTTLILDQPFFGALALRLGVVERLDIPTMATDGVNVYYNPAFVRSLTHDALIGTFAHETLHCANGHPWRRDGRDPEGWNYAADYAINYVLEEAGFKLPEGRLREAQYDGQSAEWIFNRIPKKGGGQGGGQGQGQGKGQGQGPGQGQQPGSTPSPKPGAGAQDVLDAPPVKADEAGVTEEDWQQAVQQAAVAAKGRGDLPASLKRFAEAAAKPPVDWRSATHRFAQQLAAADYTYKLPNPRYISRGLYLPALRSMEVGPIAVGIDTSGSIDGVVLGAFGHVMQAIADEVQPVCIYALYCDAKVHKVVTFQKGDPIVLEHIGGGGTDFRPVFDTLDQLDIPPVGVIYLTDLMGTFPTQEPDVPVLWASITQRKAPFGDTVYIND